MHRTHLTRPAPARSFPSLSAACVGEPVNVTGMATITSSFTGAETQIGAALIYTCNAPLTTAGGNSTQTVTCTDSGWIGGVLPCDGQ